jgi:pyruvate,water dikinase
MSVSAWKSDYGVKICGWEQLQMSEKWVFWLEEIGQEDNDLVGKKCANLGEMTRMKMPVPYGFSLSVQAQQSFMLELGVDEEIKRFLARFGGKVHSLKEYEDASKGLRQIMEAKEIPQDMRETIIAYYDNLCSRRGEGVEIAVAVRSAGAKSHPGQYETYLNIKGGGEVLNKIVKVWSSIYNTRTLASLDRQGLPVEASPLIGVGVIEMVNARCAGVGFTCDPLSGDPSRIVIEGNWGLGDSVVGGTTIPDKYVIDKDTLRITERAIGEKRMQVVAKDEGTVEEETRPDKRLSPCLNDEEVARIAELAITVETHFGVPQDVEWVISADLPFPDNVFLLQTRPVRTSVIAPAGVPGSVS